MSRSFAQLKTSNLVSCAHDKIMEHPEGFKTICSEESNKMKRENIDFERYLMDLKPSIPRGYYTDKIFKNEFLNSSVVCINKLFIFLFYNCINAKLQSADTITRRRMFQAFEIANKEKIAVEAGELSTKRSRNIETRVKNDGLQESELSFPNRNRFVFTAIIFSQFLIWLHYMAALFILQNPYNKKYGITSSKSLETHQTLVKIEDEPISLGSGQVMSQGNGTNNQLATCLRHLESYILERYGKFYVWNMSVSYLSSLPAVDNFLLVEGNPSLQMFSQEVTLFCHCLGFFLITSGILGCALAEYKPYDVAGMAFIYDPKYTSCYIKSRLCHYFNIMRVSYRNYWSRYHTDNEGALCKCLCDSHCRDDRLHQLPLKDIDESSHLSNLTSVYHAEQFDNYIPSTRSRSWRQVIMTASALLQIISSTISSVTLGILYTFCVAGNDGATKLNYEIKQFIKSSAEPPAGFSETVSNYCIRMSSSISDEREIEMLHLKFSNYVRWKIIAYFSNILRQLSPDFSMVKLDADDIQSSQGQLIESIWLPPSAEILINTKATNYEHDPLMQLHKRLALNAIEPTKKPTMINWIVPFIGGFMSCLLFAFYFTIFLSLIADLCLWLFEIRMKLDTCKILLEHYDSKARERKQMTNQQVSNYTLHSLKNLIGLVGKFREGEKIFPADQEAPILKTTTSGMDPVRCAEILGYPEEAQAERFGHSGSWVHEVHQPNLLATPLFDTSASSAIGKVSHYSKFARTYSYEFMRDQYEIGRTLIDNNSAEDQKLKESIRSNCKPGFVQVIKYVFCGRSKQRAMCASHANKIIRTDSKLRTRNGFREFKKCSDSFLLSTYLDFRLFLEQINTCRLSINFMLSYSLMQAINCIAASHFTDLMRSKIGFLICGFALANITLMGSSFFQSQCTKLNSPIHSIIASSLNGDKTIKHLAALWRRALVDLCGSRSKLSFRVYSVNISYATALQFNLGVTSLYILTLDKLRHRV